MVVVGTVMAASWMLWEAAKSSLEVATELWNRARDSEGHERDLGDFDAGC